MILSETKNFSHFGPIFCLPLPPVPPPMHTHPVLTTQKTKNWKNVKNSLRNYPFTHVQYKSRSHDVWFLRYEVQRTKFFVILGHLLPFDPCNNPKNQNLKKKKAQDNIILHLYSTNDNHMTYGS